jgi:hypothetical protein
MDRSVADADLVIGGGPVGRDGGYSLVGSVSRQVWPIRSWPKL